MATAALAITGLIAPGPAAAFQYPLRPEPRLPGAVTRPPDGIGPGARSTCRPSSQHRPPSSTPRRSTSMPCSSSIPRWPSVPAGRRDEPEESGGQARNRDLLELFDAFRTDPSAVSGDAIDGLVADLEPALRKVKIAQGRPRCVFETSIGLANLSFPHLFASRDFSQLVLMKTRRAIDRGDIDAPFRDIETVLRQVLRPPSAWILDQSDSRDRLDR